MVWAYAIMQEPAFSTDIVVDSINVSFYKTTP
jgi:hypothetical protein